MSTNQIIPGAAYLSERHILNGIDPANNYGFKLARIERSTLVYVSPPPADLVLLYAPGDDVDLRDARPYDKTRQIIITRPTDV